MPDYLNSSVVSTLKVVDILNMLYTVVHIEKGPGTQLFYFCKCLMIVHIQSEAVTVFKAFILML